MLHHFNNLVVMQMRSKNHIFRPFLKLKNAFMLLNVEIKMHT